MRWQCDSIDISQYNRTNARVCSNCDWFTGPRGLRQLGMRDWICSNCGHEHNRDHNAGKNMERTQEISLLVEERKKNSNSRPGMVVPVGKEKDLN